MRGQSHRGQAQLRHRGTPLRLAGCLHQPDDDRQRVAQRVTSSGTTTTTTTTSYVGTLETVTTSGSSTTTTNYYYAAGKLIAETVNGASTGLAGLTYLVTNDQGSPTEALDRSGVVTASRLYGPYGSVRYSNGAFPTEYGYTGQRADATTGLDYYGARYYDPLLAQFTSADTIMDGFNRYTYVGGNPTSATDPSGHELLTQDPAFDPGATAETGGGGGGGINPIPLLHVVGGALGFVGTLAWAAYSLAHRNDPVPAARLIASMVPGGASSGSTGPDELARAGERFGLNTPANGQPDILTLARNMASANRAASLRGLPKIPGMQLDEYPMASTLEGGAGADIRAIRAADNMGAGASIGNQLRPYDNGQRFRIVIC